MSLGASSELKHSEVLVGALKTLRKQMPLILSTAIARRVRRSDMLDVIIESCPTNFVPRQPRHGRSCTRRHFHLNENEWRLISTPMFRSITSSSRPRSRQSLPTSRSTQKATGFIPTTLRHLRRKRAFRVYWFEKARSASGDAT